MLGEIMDLYGQSILELVYSYVRDTALAEDLTQEIFVKCYRSLHTYNGQAKLKTWLWRIAINHCKDYLKSWYHRKVSINEKIADVAGSSTVNIEKMVMDNEDEQVLAKAVYQLPLKFREIIYLHYFEELTLKEIGQIIKVKENTIKTRLRRAKQLLRKELEGLYDGR
ncbi:sigma-70 family RNA polymerase sigma factor [Bacillus sp. 1P06AnD]|uniref:sigma-70 family RNA polymerase sigma factor n=1 Tax=Bacillus sp. 1P06AnD TaxID=3132208 RepID=UPI0039A27FC8